MRRSAHPLLLLAVAVTAQVVPAPPTISPVISQSSLDATSGLTRSPLQSDGVTIETIKNYQENLPGSLPGLLSPDQLKALMRQELGNESTNKIFDKLDLLGIGDPHICGYINTLSPTVSPVRTVGDPFTHFNGKSTQFYLPFGEEQTLIKCRGVEIRGETFGTGLKGDTQQWFRAIDVRQDGDDLVRVEVRDMSALTDPGMASFGTGSLSAAATARTRAATLLADAAASAAAAERPDASVAQIVESRVAAALQAMNWAQNFRGSGGKGQQGTTAKHLTTLNVTVEGHELTHTGAETVGRGSTEAFIAVTQDAGVKIGAGRSETVAIGARSLGVELTSAVAQKFDDKKQSVLKTHIDIRFTQLNVTECSGPLPEIWGVQPMSKTTAVMLFPPKV